MPEFDRILKVGAATEAQSEKTRNVAKQYPELVMCCFCISLPSLNAFFKGLVKVVAEEGLYSIVS